MKEEYSVLQYFFLLEGSVSQDSFAFFLYSTKQISEDILRCQTNSPDANAVMGEIPIIFHSCREAGTSLQYAGNF